MLQTSPIGGKIVRKVDASFPSRRSGILWPSAEAPPPRRMAPVLKRYIENILLRDRECCKNNPYKLNIFIEFVEDYDISREQCRTENLYLIEKQKESRVKKIPILNLITRDLQEKFQKRVCPLCSIEIDFLMAQHACPRCDTYLLNFLEILHDPSCWHVVGGEQFISQRFTKFTFCTEGRVMTEQTQRILVDTVPAIGGRRTPETCITLMFRRCENQNYVPDLVVQCARHIIQIILQHAYSVSTKNFRYYSLSVYMYTFFQKLKLPHWLKQVILSVYELLEEGHANVDLNALRNVRARNGGHTSVSLCNIY